MHTLMGVTDGGSQYPVLRIVETLKRLASAVQLPWKVSSGSRFIGNALGGFEGMPKPNVPKMFPNSIHWPQSED